MTAIDELTGRRILFLNWRDLTNPAAGGAEAYAEQIARRLAAAGCRLTLFTSAYEDAPPYDWMDQYLVVRRGGRFGVYAAAARHLRRYGDHYDAVVDFQNGIPFFSPWWAPAGTPVLCIVHHVHQDQFNMYFRWPLNVIGRLLEGRASRRAYRDCPLIAVSPSTRAEMRRQLRLRGPVYIVPNGIDPPVPGRGSRAEAPAIAVVTRLVPHKQLHLLVRAVPALLERWPDLQVDIAGEGPARAALQADVRRLGLEEHRPAAWPCLGADEERSAEPGVADRRPVAGRGLGADRSGGQRARDSRASVRRPRAPRFSSGKSDGLAGPSWPGAG